jgi:NAD-dependent DNA ligase
MNFQELSDSVRGVQNGLCDGFYAQNTTMLNGFNGVQRDMCTGFANVANGITTLGYQMKDCCCETNRNLDSVRYENAKNTCDIINAGNANTQRIIDTITQNEIQTLRDNLQTANFQLSQQAQNTTLINALSPTPRPAYITCSPYQSQVLAMNAFGNGCSCA